MLTIYLSQKHGGWNSDDNQNNNLGRFRLSITDAARTRRPTRCRTRSAKSSRSTPPSARPSRIATVFSYWRTTVPEWNEANDADRAALEAASRRLDRSWCSTNASSARATHILERGDFLKPDKGSHARRAGVPASACRRTRRSNRADLRPLAGRSQVAHHRPLDRQPRLAGVLRHRPRRHAAKTSGTQSDAAVASGTARLAGRRVHGQRLEPASTSPPDRHFGHLSAVVASDARTARARSLQPPAGARPALPRRSRDRPRHRAGRQRPAQSDGRRPERLSARARFPVPPPASYGPKTLERPRPAPNATAARSTRSAIARCPIPMLQTFDAPNGDVACVRRSALEHAAAGADHAQRAAVRGSCAGARHARRSRRAATDDATG